MAPKPIWGKLTLGGPVETARRSRDGSGLREQESLPIHESRLQRLDREGFARENPLGLV